jgi:hypothetical protein
MSAGMTEIKALFPRYKIIKEGTVTHGDCEYWLIDTKKKGVPHVVLLKSFPDGEPTMETLFETLAGIGATPTGLVDKHGDVSSFTQRHIEQDEMKWDAEYLIVAVTV